MRLSNVPVACPLSLLTKHVTIGPLVACLAVNDSLSPWGFPPHSLFERLEANPLVPY